MLIGRIGIRIVKCSHCYVYVVLCTSDYLRILLIGQARTTAIAKSAVNAWGRLEILDFAFDDMKIGPFDACPSNGNSSGNSRTCRTVADGFPYRGAANLISDIAAETPA
jgi:hypothetical protein